MQIGSLYVEILFDYLLRWFVDLPLLDDALTVILIVTVLSTVGRLSLLVIMMVIMTVTVSMSMAMLMMVMMVMVAVSTTVSVAVIVTMSRAALPADMDVATLPRVQYFDLDAIENAAQERNSEHDWPFDLGWIKESLRCFDQKPGCHDPDGEN